MREILFRGKRVDNGEWVEGCYAEFVHGFDGYTKPGIQVTRCVPSVANRLTPTYETELVEVFPETVGQYTGLTDKNGKKIFEGDLVNEDDYTGENGEIVWDSVELEWAIKIENIEQKLGSYYSTELEIMDNIHDKEE